MPQTTPATNQSRIQTNTMKQEYNSKNSFKVQNNMKIPEFTTPTYHCNDMEAKHPIYLLHSTCIPSFSGVRKKEIFQLVVQGTERKF